MGKYDPWREFFSQIEGDEVVLTLEELEVALGAKLPPSARRYSEWWASAHYYAKWVDQGFIASPRLDEGQVTFRRGTVKRGRPHRMVPGALDSPAWVIGRTWCRPAGPLCMSCVLSDPCARRIDAGDTVRGV